MSSVVTLFQAYLNADNIYIDYNNLPDPIKHNFLLLVKNQYTSTLYFRITSYLSNWTITSPLDGKLGGVSPTSQSVFTITMTRPKPTTETVDTGYFKIEVFSDSNYTVKVGEAILNVTVYIEDLENWTDVIISDFNDGTSQGWILSSGVSVSDDRSLEPMGYSLKCGVSATETQFYIYKNITLPNRNKVRINFYVSLYAGVTGTVGRTATIKNISIKVNDAKVFDIPTDTISIYVSNYTGPLSAGWYKLCADLSPYKGQTVTLRIEWTLSIGSYGYVYSWLDRIVIAGKD
jgi:hypothetical protein